MNAELHIEADYSISNDGDWTRPIIRYEHELELSFTLTIGGYKSIRKRLKYYLKGKSNDPMDMVNKVLIDKSFNPEVDLFMQGSEYGPEDITNLNITWDENNAFLQVLFSVVKKDKLLEAFA